MKTIRKKIHPEHFAAVLAGQKHAELRKEDDVRFDVGDLLILEEWDPTERSWCMSPGAVPIMVANGYTGHRIETVVTNVVREREGLAPGWAMVSVEVLGKDVPPPMLFLTPSEWAAKELVEKRIRPAPSADVVTALQRFVDWCEEYPSSRIYSYGEIVTIVRKMDEIHEAAKAALRSAPSAKEGGES